MTLKDAILTVIDESQRLDMDAFEDEMMFIEDELSCGERGDDLYLGAVIDGIRYGVRAAVMVELGGGAMLRSITPGGARITHEWGDARQADAAMTAAMVAAMPKRTEG